jgi:hypothetical protein
MSIPRVWYVLLQVFYLILIAIALWGLIFYSGIPSAVVAPFVVAVALLLISIFIKEYCLRQTYDESGKAVGSAYYTWWVFFYVLLVLMALIALGIGLYYCVRDSTVNAWGFITLIVGMMLVAIATGILAIWQTAFVWFIIFAIVGAILLALGFFLFLVYLTGVQWWVFLVLAIAIILCYIALILEPLSNQNIEVKDLGTGLEVKGSTVLTVDEPKQYGYYLPTAISYNKPQEISVPYVQDIPPITRYYYPVPYDPLAAENQQTLYSRFVNTVSPPPAGTIMVQQPAGVVQVQQPVVQTQPVLLQSPVVVQSQPVVQVEPQPVLVQ